MPRVTKVKPAPLKYPKGGGIKAAQEKAKPNPKTVAGHKMEIQGKIMGLKAKHEEKFGPTKWDD